MKVMLTGAAGQLGRALVEQVPAGVELVSLTRTQLDLADLQACRAAVLEHRPDWLINAGAYTAVDQAELDSERAWAVNAAAPEALAAALADCGGQLLQLSTDFVFDGGQGRPYRPEQPPSPLGVYGASKAAGEQVALSFAGGRVLRTSWLYGPVGRNFCLTLLRLHHQRAESGDPISVVADQVACPTATCTLAEACWRLIGLEAPLPRILHWSDAGAASWYDFAVAIGELAVAVGLLEQAAPVQPIPTSGYPTPASRPSYSLLDCFETQAALALQPPHWRQALETVLRRLSPEGIVGRREKATPNLRTGASP